MVDYAFLTRIDLSDAETYGKKGNIVLSHIWAPREQYIKGFYELRTKLISGSRTSGGVVVNPAIRWKRKFNMFGQNPGGGVGGGGEWWWPTQTTFHPNLSEGRP